MTVDDKSVLRRQVLAARAEGGDAAALTRNLQQALSPWAGEILAGYWPIRGEADPRPAMALHDGPLCLPVVVRPATPLLFRLWDGTDETLERGSFNTSHPRDSQPQLSPRIVIIPLAGFDRAGNRLGYGGGFYDRTLEVLRRQGPVAAIACAYAVQELPMIPAEPTDQPVDMIVTDQEIITPRKR